MFDQVMDEIIIAKYQKSINGSIIQPTINSSLMTYIAKSQRLSFTKNQVNSTLYIIKAVTSANHKVNMNISTTYQTNMIITTNQRQNFTFGQYNSIVTYKYYSNNDFRIFITSDWGNFKLTVTDFKRDQKAIVIDQMIRGNSNPSIKVNGVTGDIREYIIKLEDMFQNKFQSNGQRTNLQ